MKQLLDILGYIALILTFSGTICNLAIAYVSIKSKSNSTIVLLRYLAFSDMCSLYFWNLSHFIEAIFGIDIQNFSLIGCKFGSWIQYSSLQSSAWTLVKSNLIKIKKNYKLKYKKIFKVLMSIDRYLIFKIKNWKKVYFTQGIAAVTGLILLLVIFLANSNVLFLYGYVHEFNQTIKTECFTTIPSTMWMQTWGFVSIICN